MVRESVVDFAKLGHLPAESASEEMFAIHQALLAKIDSPISDDEAKVLIQSFGPDDAFGLAWTLLHLVESAPGGAQLSSEPKADDNEWLRRLWARAHRPEAR
jgi:hypothetical protein